MEEHKQKVIEKEQEQQKEVEEGLTKGRRKSKKG